MDQINILKKGFFLHLQVKALPGQFDAMETTTIEC